MTERRTSLADKAYDTDAIRDFEKPRNCEIGIRSPTNETLLGLDPNVSERNIAGMRLQSDETRIRVDTGRITRTVSLAARWNRVTS